VWQFEQVQPFNAKEAAAGYYDKITTKRRFDYPMDMFDVYKSAEVHTHKRRLPLRKLFILGGAIALVAVAGVVAWRTAGGLGAHAKELIASAPGGKEKDKVFLTGLGTLGDRAKDLRGADHPTLEEWVSLRRERIKGVPETKPLFDELTKPLTFPRVAMCGTRAKSNGCWCWTQQATIVSDVPEGVCRNFVVYGTFDEHRGPAEDTGAGIGALKAQEVKQSGLKDSASPLTGASAQGGGVKEGARGADYMDAPKAASGIVGCPDGVHCPKP
jgi:zona occludens toxin